MNLNEICLLEFLKNFIELSQLSSLLCEDFEKNKILNAVQYENYVI